MRGKGTSVVDLCYKFEYMDNSVPKDEYLAFIDETKSIINHKRNWKSYLICDDPIDFYNIRLVEHDSHNGHCNRIVFVKKQIVSGKSPHMIITLVSDSYIRQEACPEIDGESSESNISLSCTSISGNNVPTYVYINYNNWKKGFCTALNDDGYKTSWNVKENVCDIVEHKKFVERYPCFKHKPELMIKEYRQYVINHEVGHALGRGHFLPNTKNKKQNVGVKIPVMAQQTKTLANYNINTWPLPTENCEIAADVTEHEHVIAIK